MVKVKDTASFIQAARVVHGDKYDYSRVNWMGSRSPVVIGCPQCGFIEVKDPTSHYSKKRSGCGKCNHKESAERRRKKCFVCNVNPIQKNSKYCLKCKPTMPACVVCGCTLGNPRGIKCNRCRLMLIQKARDERPKDEWTNALIKANNNLIHRSRKRELKGWDRWANTKASILTSRRIDYALRLRATVSSWSAWELRMTKKQVARKAEDEWTKRLRNWGRSLSQRAKKQGVENSVR